MGEILAGCCGWPEARARYFEHFPVVELQDTFYQPPSVELAAKRRAQAPADFRFTMKAWQLITHPASSPTYRRLKTPPSNRAACGAFQATDEVWKAWQITLTVAQAVRAEVIVFQCPQSFTPTDEHAANLETFFSRIGREGRLVAWEPRGAWDPQAVGRLCKQLDLIHCVDPFAAEPVHAPVAYFRLHGRGGYGYQYTGEELQWLGDRCVAQRGSPVYVLFNNVYMKDDALRFHAILNSRR